MHQFFLICATIGGTILILRLGLSLLGLGFDSLDGSLGDFGDADADAGFGDDASADPAGPGSGHHTDLGRIFTFQAIVSFLAFFGIGGLAALESKQHATVAVLIGSATGFVAVTLLGYILRALRKLNTDGTVRISGAVGLEGKVYLRIPADGAGEGKITLPIQGRTIEILARTPGPGLRTGETVVVSRVIDEKIVEVVTPPAHLVKPASFAE
ncbi:hypothetical protein P12x_002098 [Tundrisphaera lichenicola]|uniref:hypothetical protein n=1 Tax=Tundrisphaera lichenicola TaxID=2029860 RepID=UPI003EBC1C6E